MSDEIAPATQDFYNTQAEVWADKEDDDDEYLDLTLQATADRYEDYPEDDEEIAPCPS